MMRKPAETKQPGQQSKCVISQRLVNEWLLTLQRLNRAAGRKLVFLVQFGIDDFGEEFRHGRQPQMASLILTVFRLAQYELSGTRIVAQIKPVMAVPVSLASWNLIPGLSRIVTPN